jgi:hypothetical protein
LGEHGLDIEQSQPSRIAGRAFHAVGIGDARAQHLVAGAQAQHMAAAARMRQDVDVPAFGAQRGEVGERRLRAGQQHEIGERQRAARRHQLERDAGLGAQRIEIVEIGDARQARHGDGERRLVPLRAPRPHLTLPLRGSLPLRPGGRRGPG